MPPTLEYLRPTTLDEALRLLRRPGLHTAPLAGGVWLTPRLRRDVEIPDPLDEAVDAVVDLADLGLSGIWPDGAPGDGWLRLGATTTLAQISDDPLCRAVAGGILAYVAAGAVPRARRRARATTPPRG